MVRSGRRGMVGRRGTVRLGVVCPGSEWFGLAGVVGWVSARRGTARPVEASPGRQFTEVSMVYEWKRGSRLSVDAQAVGEELERIECKDASSVVKAARKSKGALHDCFEWDDTKAGEEYRKEQARLVLRMIVTTIEREVGGEVESVQIRAYESVRFAQEDESPEKTMTYVPTREALSDPELRVQIMDRLDSTIAEAERTADVYSYLAPALKKTKDKLTEARATIHA
jgi:hypothetical protein